MIYAKFEALVDIGVNTGLSAATDITGAQITKIYIPSTFDGTVIKFHQSEKPDGTYSVIQENGVDYSLTVAASAWQIIPTKVLEGVGFVKIATATAQSTTNTLFLLTGTRA